MKTITTHAAASQSLEVLRRVMQKHTGKDITLAAHDVSVSKLVQSPPAIGYMLDAAILGNASDGSVEPLGVVSAYVEVGGPKGRISDIRFEHELNGYRSSYIARLKYSESCTLRFILYPCSIEIVPDVDVSRSC